VISPLPHILFGHSPDRIYRLVTQKIEEKLRKLNGRYAEVDQVVFQNYLGYRPLKLCLLMGRCGHFKHSLPIQAARPLAVSI
jgi:hypothetical protein